MTKFSADRRGLARVLCALPTIQRQDFRSAASMQIFDRSRLREAAWFATSFNMEGATRLHRCVRDDNYWWEFELCEDAILFRLRFDAVPHKPMSNETWKRITMK